MRISYNMCVDHFRRVRRKPTVAPTETFDIFNVLKVSDDNAEDRIIKGAILDFADRGFPLQKSYIRDKIQLFVSRLPLSRRSCIPFKNNRPGPDFIKTILRRHPQIEMRRRAALELRRKITMSPRNISMHYARLMQAYASYRITSPAPVFKIDESDVLSRTGGRVKGHAAMRACGRSNAVYL